MTHDFDSGLEDTHVQVLELLPWYVNDTLNESEQRLVKAHLLLCGRCNTELNRCQNMVSAVHRDQEQSWQQKPDQLSRIFQQINQLEEDQKSTPPSYSAGISLHFSHLSRWLFGQLNLPRWSLAVPAALALGLTAVLTMQTVPEDIGKYETLTSSDTLLDAPEQRLQLIFSPDSTSSEITQLLRSLDIDARIVDGPSAQGRYTVAIAANQHVEMTQLASELQGSPVVIFAQPEK